MIPSEMQEVMAKILLIVFAVLVLCFSPAKAQSSIVLVPETTSRSISNFY